MPFHFWKLPVPELGVPRSDFKAWNNNLLSQSAGSSPPAPGSLVVTPGISKMPEVITPLD
ncbi:hypothetical protein PGTUg99_000724 [Puccinia graminis f. sp. tritici]|uniref:Uncharacterized protein n=1 Tax=Puccinia graminis f. sp. tritici TaxID=56615 RepID=A0A5B0P9I9_PUCGR|nr:hypothetical protein PGTUg99_000724 [Puccinia graminis f. sp. tritici]